MPTKEIWHCVFCGRHFNGPPTFEVYLQDRKPPWIKFQCCPHCREYKGLEVCDLDTCEVWTLDVIRNLVEKEVNNEGTGNILVEGGG
jgi:hypothetical protein